ncbi:MAG TPA: LysR family transcriptional regulator [Alphaproteobacteria bacterium]
MVSFVATREFSASSPLGGLPKAGSIHSRFTNNERGDGSSRSMKVFVRTAETGSLSGAARQRRCSKSVVTRRIAHPDTWPFQRSTRRVRLRDAGVAGKWNSGSAHAADRMRVEKRDSRTAAARMAGAASCGSRRSIRRRTGSRPRFGCSSNSSQRAPGSSRHGIPRHGAIGRPQDRLATRGR